jgi:hypothetical protein
MRSRQGVTAIAAGALAIVLVVPASALAKKKTIGS